MTRQLITMMIGIVSITQIVATETLAQSSEPAPENIQRNIDPRRVIPGNTPAIELPENFRATPQEATGFWAIPPAPVGIISRDREFHARGETGESGLVQTGASVMIAVMNPNNVTNASVKVYCRDGEGNAVSEHSAQVRRGGFARISITAANPERDNAQYRWCTVSSDIGVLAHAYLIETDVYQPLVNGHSTNNWLINEVRHQPIAAIPLHFDRD